MKKNSKKENNLFNLLVKIILIFIYLPMFSVLVQQNFGILLWKGMWVLWLKEFFYFLILVIGVFIPYQLIINPEKKKLENFKVSVFATGIYRFFVLLIFFIFRCNTNYFNWMRWKIFSHISLFVFLLFFYTKTTQKKQYFKILLAVIFGLINVYFLSLLFFYFLVVKKHNIFPIQI